MNDAISIHNEKQAFEAWFDSWADPHVGVVETAIKKQGAWAAWVQRACNPVSAAPTIHKPVTPAPVVITDPVAIRETFERDDLVGPAGC